MNKFFTLALFFTACFAFAQKVLPYYPNGQDAYQGGAAAMFGEMQQYFVSSNLKPCAKQEMYWVHLKIDETGKPALVRRKNDAAAVEKNRCAYELAVRSLGTLRKWQPAEVNGKKVTAHFDFPFHPADFFDSYIPGYDITTTINRPALPGGVNAFRKEFHKYVGGYLDWDSYRPEGVFMLSFDVGPTGKMENFDIEPKIANSDRLLADIVTAVKKMKKTWTPAKLNGVPVKYTFRLPINFSTEHYTEDF